MGSTSSSGSGGVGKDVWDTGMDFQGSLSNILGISNPQIPPKAPSCCAPHPFGDLLRALSPRAASVPGWEQPPFKENWETIPRDMISAKNPAWSLMDPSGVWSRAGLEAGTHWPRAGGGHKGPAATTATLAGPAQSAQYGLWGGVGWDEVGWGGMGWNGMGWDGVG